MKTFLLPAIPRGILRLAGADRARFLHGMATSHVKGLKPGESQRSLHVSAKGKVLAMLSILAEADALWVETDADRVAFLKAALEKMVIMDDVVIEDRSSDFSVIALAGEGNLLQGLSGKRLGFCRTGPGAELWVPPADADRIRQALLTKGAVLLDAEGEEALRIANAMPRFGVDVTDQNLPQEAGLDEDTGWISYAKGCYVGQETIARLHALGQVQQRLAVLKLQGKTAPGAAVHAGADLAGRVTSVSKEGLAMAMLKRAWLAQGTRLDVEGIQAEVTARTT